MLNRISWLKEAAIRVFMNTGFTVFVSSFDLSDKTEFLRYPTAVVISPFYLLRKLFNLISRRFEVDYAEIFLTTRCTLNCRDCSVLVPYIGKPVDYDCKDIKGDISAFLDSIDRIYKFGMLGGESMLHRDFTEILSFLEKSQKVKSIRVVTNGTYIPGDHILNALSESKKVHLNISSYPGMKKSVVTELSQKLKERGVRYSVYSGMQWFDLGAVDMKPEKRADVIEGRFRNCWMRRCPGIRDGRLYHCGRAAFLPLARSIEGGESDYVSLHATDDTRIRRDMIRQLFKSKTLAACAYCYGTLESRRVEPAIQAIGKSEAEIFINQ